MKNSDNKNLAPLNSLSRYC